MPYAILVVIVVGVLVFGDVFHNARADNAAKIRANCVASQQVYDGQFKFARFLGAELHATQEEIDRGLADLARTLGPRPTC